MIKSKEVMTMRDKFNTSIDSEILQQFKNKCKEDGFPVSFVLENFMRGYIDEKFKLKMEYSKDGK